MLIFLDFETTGLEYEDKIVSSAILVEDEENSFVKYELVNEGKKIPPKASSIHHITTQMIKDKPPFKESEIYKFLKQNNKKDTTIVAHNAKFDLDKLLACGIDFKGKVIDTLRVTKHLIPECEFFSLQFLRYELQLYKKELGENIVAHNSLGDVKVLKNLYDYLLEIADNKTMCELSQKKVLQQKLDFGKYSGKYIEEIMMSDSSYLAWMLSIEDLDEDLRYSIEYYL